MNRYQDILPPLWSTIALAVATLVTNWIWAAWFGETDGTGLMALALASIFFWPVTLALISLALGYTLHLCEDHAFLRVVIVLGVLAVGTAVYGVPGPWNLLICATVAIAAGLQARRTAQDDADLEDL
jgi:hypothetical protein